jgi:serine kinase of HPr protein (carbohydrate metabolism regulator)
MLNLPVSGARSMCEIIEVAVTNLKLKEEGFDSTFEFENRMNELLLRKKMMRK